MNKRRQPRFETGVGSCPNCGRDDRVHVVKAKWRGVQGRCWACGHLGPRTAALWLGSPANGPAWKQLWNEQFREIDEIPQIHRNK